MGILAMVEKVLFIRTSVSGGIVSRSQMPWNLSQPRTDRVKRGFPTSSSFLSTVIWVKNCCSKKGIKQSEMQSE